MSDPNRNIQEAYRLAELKLASQFTASIAADQRATGASGMFVAAAAISATLADTATSPGFMLAGAAGLVVAAFLAAFSARPVRFNAPGAKFSDLDEDIAINAEHAHVLTELGRYHDKHIDQNDKIMTRNATYLKTAFLIATTSAAAMVCGQVYLACSGD